MPLASIGVTDDRSGIPRCGEGTVLQVVAVWVDNDLHRRRVSAILVVITDERFDAGPMTESNTGAGAVLDDDKTLSSICVEHGRAPQFATLNYSLTLHKSATWIFEPGAGLGVRVHFRHELVGCKFGSWI